jgi:hypothetical protein
VRVFRTTVLFSAAAEDGEAFGAETSPVGRIGLSPAKTLSSESLSSNLVGELRLDLGDGY